MSLTQYLLSATVRLTKIVLTIAMAVVAISVFAAPVTPSDIQTARAAGQLDQTWISGASSMAGNVYIGFNQLSSFIHF